MEGEQHLYGESKEPDPPSNDPIRPCVEGAGHSVVFDTAAEGLRLLGAINAQIKKLEDQRFETVRELRHAGAPWREIAAALGEQTATVYQRWARRM